MICHYSLSEPVEEYVGCLSTDLVLHFAGRLGDLAHLAVIELVPGVKEWVFAEGGVVSTIQGSIVV